MDEPRVADDDVPCPTGQLNHPRRDAEDIVALLHEEGIPFAHVRAATVQFGKPRIAARERFVEGTVTHRFRAVEAIDQRFGTPEAPRDLAEHTCLLVLSEGKSLHWPFETSTGLEMVQVFGQCRFTSFAMAHRAALAGLGVALFPEFACTADIEAGRLVPLFSDAGVHVGSVSIVYPAERFLAPRIKRFLEIVSARFDAPA